MVRIVCFLCLLFAAPDWAAANPGATTPATPPRANPTSAARPASALQFPRIATAGGVYALPAGVDMPSANVVHRLLIAAHDDQTVVGGINGHLDLAARALNLYALAKVPPKHVEVAVVVYGEATRLVLSDASYRRQFGKPNPDAKLLAELHRAGVKIYVCGQALSRQGYVVDDVREDVQVSLSAITKTAELQASGYSLVP